jgi:hypothetical protein
VNAPSAHSAADPAPDAAARRAERRVRALQALVETGLKAAEALQMQIEAAATAPAVDPAAAAKVSSDLARAFAQVSRAVSVAVALEDKLDQAPETRRLEAQAQAARRRAEAARAAEPEIARRRAKVGGAVEAVIVSREGSLSSLRGADLKKALDRLLELEVQDLDVFLERPAGELVARLCRDLGLKPDWRRWDHDWAVEAEQADLAPRRRPARPQPPDPRSDPLPEPARLGAAAPFRPPP